MFSLIQIDAEAGAEISLLVQINGKGPISCPGKADRQVQGDCCLAATTFGIGKCEDLSHNTLPPLAATSYFLGIADHWPENTSATVVQRCGVLLEPKPY